MITLYHCNTSLASSKVRIYLAEKHLAWDEVHLDLRKQENLTSDYRKINPIVTVPALKDDAGKIHVGSTEIMEYLETLHPQPPLLPQNPQQRKQIHDICKAHEILHEKWLRVLTYSRMFMNPEKRKSLDIEHMIAVSKTHPVAAKRDFYIHALTGNLSVAEIEAAKHGVIAALLTMEKLLQQANNGFLIGKNYSLADVVCTASIYRVTQIGPEDEIVKLPQLKIWWQSMQNRPSFKAGILDFWNRK